LKRTSVSTSPVATTYKKHMRDTDSATPHEGRTKKNKAEYDLVKIMGSMVDVFKSTADTSGSSSSTPAASTAVIEAKLKAESMAVEDSRYITLSKEIQQAEIQIIDCKAQQRKLTRMKEKLEREISTLTDDGAIEAAESRLMDLEANMEAEQSKYLHAQRLIEFCRRRCEATIVME
jgi:hypothetical protein